MNPSQGQREFPLRATWYAVQALRGAACVPRAQLEAAPTRSPLGSLRPGAQALRLPLLWDWALLDSGCLEAQAKLVSDTWGLLTGRLQPGPPLPPAGALGSVLRAQSHGAHRPPLGAS